MKKILMLLTLILSLQSFAGTTESNVQEEKPTDVALQKGKSNEIKIPVH